MLAVSCSVVSNSETPWTPCSPPGSSVHGILQAGILEWVAISFSRRSSRPRNRSQDLLRAHHVSVPLYTSHTASFNTQHSLTIEGEGSEMPSDSPKFTQPKQAQARLEILAGWLCQKIYLEEKWWHDAIVSFNFYFPPFLGLSSTSPAGLGENFLCPPKRLRSSWWTFLTLGGTVRHLTRAQHLS